MRMIKLEKSLKETQATNQTKSGYQMYRPYVVHRAPSLATMGGKGGGSYQRL